MVEVVLSPAVTNQLDRPLVRGRGRPSRPVRHEQAEAFLQRDGQELHRGRFVAPFYVPGQVRHDKTSREVRLGGGPIRPKPEREMRILSLHLQSEYIFR